MMNIRPHVAVLARERDLSPLLEGIRAALRGQSGGDVELIGCATDSPTERMTLAACDLVIAGSSLRTDEDLREIAPMLERVRSRKPAHQRKPLVAFALWGSGAPALAREADHPAIVATTEDVAPVDALAARLRLVTSKIEPLAIHARISAMARALEIERLELEQMRGESEAVLGAELDLARTRLAEAESKLGGAEAARLAREKELGTIAEEAERRAKRIATLEGELERATSFADDARRLSEDVSKLEWELASAQAACRDGEVRTATLEKDGRAKDARIAELLRENADLERQATDGAMSLLGRDARIYELERTLRTAGMVVRNGEGPPQGKLGARVVETARQLPPDVRADAVQSIMTQLRALGYEVELPAGA